MLKALGITITNIRIVKITEEAEAEVLLIRGWARIWKPITNDHPIFSSIVYWSTE